MIAYQPGKWSVSFAWQLKGSVFPKSFAWAFPCSIFATALHVVLHLDEEIAQAVYPGKQAATILSGFTFILGFLVVFRSQQAYSRWWEGGTLLQEIRGEWFNAFSCLMAFCNPAAERKYDVAKFQHTLVRLVSLLYNCALQQVSTMENTDFELINLTGFDIPQLQFLEYSHDRVEIALQWVQKLIVEAEAAKTIVVAPPILSRVFNQLGNGIVKVQNARKISEFPIPFPYAQMVTCMLLGHWVLTLLMCATASARPWTAGVLSFIVVFSFWSINYIGVELEMPFGDDDNDLPLQGMMRDLNESLIELLRNEAQSVPEFTYDPEEHALNFSEDITFEEYLAKFDSMTGTFHRVDGESPQGHGAAKSRRTYSPAQASAVLGMEFSGYSERSQERRDNLFSSERKLYTKEGHLNKQDQISRMMVHKVVSRSATFSKLDTKPSKIGLAEPLISDASTGQQSPSLQTAQSTLFAAAATQSLQPSHSTVAISAADAAGGFEVDSSPQRGPVSAQPAKAGESRGPCGASQDGGGSLLAAGTLLEEALISLGARLEALLEQISSDTRDMRALAADAGFFDARGYTAPSTARGAELAVVMPTLFTAPPSSRSPGRPQGLAPLNSSLLT